MEKCDYKFINNPKVRVCCWLMATENRREAWNTTPHGRWTVRPVSTSRVWEPRLQLLAALSFLFQPAPSRLLRLSLAKQQNRHSVNGYVPFMPGMTRCGWLH